MEGVILLKSLPGDNKSKQLSGNTGDGVRQELVQIFLSAGERKKEIF